PHASRALEPGRAGKPFASRPAVGVFPQGIADRRDEVRRLVAEILPHRRGRGRRLSAVLADDGVGYGGGRRGATRRRRSGARPFRAAAFLRQSRERIAQWTLHRLGGRDSGEAIWILKCSPAGLWGVIHVCKRGGANVAKVNRTRGLLTIC